MGKFAVYTGFLTNHFPNRGYFKKFGLAEDDICRLCTLFINPEITEHIFGQ